MSKLAKRRRIKYRNRCVKYQKFLKDRTHISKDYGFVPLWLHDELFDFQRNLVEWSLKKGRAAIFADCGLGKTLIQLVWAENVIRKTNGRVLILTPLAVGQQTQREGEKFGIECVRSSDGKWPDNQKIIITNYERLHYFDPGSFAGAVCDESSILKNFDGKTKAAITEFMRKLPYRLLCTATAAPNDYIELGTSSEALGDMGYIDMLQRFFKADDSSYAQGQSGNRFSRNPLGGKFRFKGYAEHDFWRWVCSWARAIRKPSDLGYDDGPFILPDLRINQHEVKAKIRREGWLFDTPAITLLEQRQERRRTLHERCEKVAELINNNGDTAVAWCHLNDEGNLLEELIHGSIQVAGGDSDEVKEERFCAFQDGNIRVLITKPTIAGFGLNWQHCAHQTFFPSHSYEQWYQAIRRSWRFGQEHDVVIDVVTSEGEANVLINMQRKGRAAKLMFGRLVDCMNDELKVDHLEHFDKKEEVPSWL